MPDNYAKGRPHEHASTISGHYIGMAYIPVGFDEKIAPQRLWARWDDYLALRQEVLTLKAEISALQSREVCAAAHENVEECGYCQRDRLLAELRERSPDATSTA
jgi:hypothetical protein